MVVYPMTNQVFLAVAPKKWGTSVSIFEITSGRFMYVNSYAVGKKTNGDLRVKLLSLNNEKLVLITGMVGKKTTLKSWQYSEFLSQFSRTVSNDRHVKMKKTVVSWR